MSATKTFSTRHAGDDDAATTLLAAIDAASDFATEAQLAPGHSARLAIIVEELVANILRHGAAGRDVDIALVLEDRSDAITLHLTDSGDAFDPREVPEISGPDPETGGGVGLALIMAWSTIAAYAREDGQNRLELRLPKGG